MYANEHMTTTSNTCKSVLSVGNAMSNTGQGHAFVTRCRSGTAGLSREVINPLRKMRIIVQIPWRLLTSDTGGL
jgi:hypothetical protein